MENCKVNSLRIFAQFDIKHFEGNAEPDPILDTAPSTSSSSSSSLAQGHRHNGMHQGWVLPWWEGGVVEVVVIVGVDVMVPWFLCHACPFLNNEFLRKLQNANGERKAKGQNERQWRQQRLNTSKSRKQKLEIQ